MAHKGSFRLAWKLAGAELSERRAVRKGPRPALVAADHGAAVAARHGREVALLGEARIERIEAAGRYRRENAGRAASDPNSHLSRFRFSIASRARP